MGIMNIQAGMMKAGLMNHTVTPDNIYQSARRYAKAVFPKEADSFFTDPKTVQPPPPTPNVDLLKVQLAAQKAAAGNKQKYDKMMLDYVNAEKDRSLALKQMGIDTFGQYADMQQERLIAEREAMHAGVSRTTKLK